MAYTIGSVPAGFDIPGSAVVIPLPPRNGGGMGWGPVWLSFGTDFGDARLRLATWNDGTRSWRIDYVDVLANGGRVNHPGIQDGDSKVSVLRVARNAGDLGTSPVSYMVEALLKA